jgi:serine/threonine protein kinase
MFDTPASPVTSRVLRRGARLGRYTIVKRIGCGGMAELYLARADGVGGFEKALALKVVHAHLVQQASALRMFLREARLAASLEHPNIVQVHDVGVFGGEHVLVMEYVHGRDVGQILGHLPEGQALPLGCGLRIILDVGAALDYVHTKADADGNPLGLVHRDVSPANVLVAFNGAVKLVDFGIAKISAHGSTTQTGTLKGKFGYMSPEQSMGEHVDARSDIFALGVLLYEVTTGRRAFAGDNAFAIMNRVIEGEYAPPQDVVLGYPEALSRIVERALAVDPAERYQTVRELLLDLESHVASAGVQVERRSLTEYLGALFGDPAYPDLSGVMALDDEALATVPSLPTARVVTQRRAARVGMIAAGALGLGIAAGWYVATDARMPPGGATNSAPTQPAELQPAPVLQTAVVPVPLAFDAEPATEHGSELTHEDRAKPRRSRATKKRRARRSSTSPESAERRDLDSMFPRSMQ